MSPDVGQVILDELAEMRREHKADLERLEIKVDATNGRVRALEKAKAYAEGAKAAMTWAPKLAFALAVAIAGSGTGALIAVLIGH